jgi:hypothetical protein
LKPLLCKYYKLPLCSARQCFYRILSNLAISNVLIAPPSLPDLQPKAPKSSTSMHLAASPLISATHKICTTASPWLKHQTITIKPGSKNQRSPIQIQIQIQIHIHRNARPRKQTRVKQLNWRVYDDITVAPLPTVNQDLAQLLKSRQLF